MMSPIGDLTKNQKFVLDVLKKERAPLSAYAILDQLRNDGFRAPLQIYRALDKLIAIGAVHKLESLNAYIACAHPDCDDHHLVAFAICKNCGKVHEFSNHVIEHEVHDHMHKINFRPHATTLEIRGLCENCAEEPSNA
ncbi:transcriptional repressor [Bartonella sp. HY329]|uniref:Fur family transcriptional regulator n=1 Tax=unclassified Bartonella TaxID=2645622 RepID=UPI0021C8BB85|nr:MULTISPECIES: Fur family transcriptional regulator [unclassified Bartonella]UXM93861.1 transcriptional repressor [Bartonella sp. HY329]UXN08182.1 transcriptional repressor [Bartonella sp. HY328]